MNNIQQVFYHYTPSIEQSMKEKNEFEIYAKKIDLDYILMESFVPTKSIEETEQVIGKYFPYLLPLEKHRWPNILGSGTGANFNSHLLMWEKIVESGKTTAIFEHDARPLIKFDHFDLPDNFILILGPRIMDVKDYTPSRLCDKFYQIERHGGSAAYAITPKTAEMFIDHVKKEGIYDSLDQMFFLRLNNKSSKIPMAVADPPPCVVVVGENDKIKKSTLGRVSDNGMQSDLNLYITPGFKEGLKND